jgi:hypothetical protein
LIHSTSGINITDTRSVITRIDNSVVADPFVDSGRSILKLKSVQRPLAGTGDCGVMPLREQPYANPQWLCSHRNVALAPQWGVLSAG